MELEQLRQLVEIERQRTISAAADVLHITQPALSRSIRRLEQDLGQELFVHGRNSVTLNDVGRLAVRHANRILADVRLMRDDFDTMTQRNHTILIATVAPSPSWKLNNLVINRFPEEIPAPQIMEEDRTRSALMNREVDLAITSTSIDLPTIQSVPIMQESLYALIPNESPLSDHDAVTFADLDGLTFIIYKAIGVWMDVARTYMPHSQLIVQEDRGVFVQLLTSRDMFAFSSSTPAPDVTALNRKRIPISDESAQKTFYLSAWKESTPRIQKIIDAVASENVANAESVK